MKTTRMPIILVHGWAGSAEAWAPIAERLAAVHDGPIIELRLPGSPGAAPGFAPTIPAAVDLLTTEITRHDGPVILVGHSMGAQVTARAHASVPDRVVSEVVIDPAYGADASTRQDMSVWADRISGEGHQAVMDFFRSASEQVAEPTGQRILEDVLATAPDVIAAYLRSEYVDDDAVGLLPATQQLAAQRVRPVLAIHSTPRGALRESELAAPKGSRTDVWGGYSHYLHLENPDRFVAELVRWCVETDAAVPVATDAASILEAAQGSRP